MPKRFKSIKKSTQPVENKRDNPIYENAYQQFYGKSDSKGGYVYKSVDDFNFNPNTSNKINRFVYSMPQGIHAQRHGTGIPEGGATKRNRIKKLKKDYFQLQLTQNPEKTRKENWKQTKDFTNKEIKPRVKSKFADYTIEANALTRSKNKKEKLSKNFYGISAESKKGILHNLKSKGSAGLQTPSDLSLRKVKNIYKASVKDFHGYSSSQARKQVMQDLSERKLGLDPSWTKEVGVNPRDVYSKWELQLSKKKKI